LRNSIKRPFQTEGAAKPAPLLRGTKLICWSTDKTGDFNGPKTITENSIYTVINHFSYVVERGLYIKWNQFVTIENDEGKIIKVNLNRFRIWET